MPDKCDPIRSKLHDLEVELGNTERFLRPEPDDPHPLKPHANPEWSALASSITKIRLALQRCEESLVTWTVTGAVFVGSLEIDAAAMQFMKARTIRAMSVAIAREGTLLANRGYTWAEPGYPITQPDTLFRVASVSKMFTCAAIDRLVTTGALNLTTPAFAFLGITGRLLPDQVPDPDIAKITVGNLALEKSGLQHDFGVDFRAIASRLGQGVTPTRTQLVQYLYGEPLVARPGSDAVNYSNSAFTVLTSIVEKASGRSFIDYLRDAVVTPFHINDVHVGVTAVNGRIPNEVSSYDDPGFSPSQIDLAPNAIAPNAYGGTFALENGEGAGGLIMSTGTAARFLATHQVYGIGPRKPGLPWAARYGNLSGTGAAAVSRPDGIDFAYAFNHLVSDPDHDALVTRINAVLDHHTRVQNSGVFASIQAFAVGVVTFVQGVFGLRRPDDVDFAFAFNLAVDHSDHALVERINAILDRNTMVQSSSVFASIREFLVKLVTSVQRVYGSRREP